MQKMLRTANVQRPGGHDTSLPETRYAAGYCKHAEKCAKRGEKCCDAQRLLDVEDAWLSVVLPPAPEGAAIKVATEVCAAPEAGGDVFSAMPPGSARYIGIVDVEGGANDRPGEVRPSAWRSAEWRAAKNIRSRYLNSLSETQDEIIELPCLLIDTWHAREVARFHRFVRPVSWDKFLQGQPESRKNEMSNAVPFTKALADLEQFLKEQGALDSILMVTCGDWDLKTIVPKQCVRSE